MNILPELPMTTFDALRELLDIVKEFSDDVEPVVIIAAIEALFKPAVAAALAPLYSMLAELRQSDGCSGECVCKVEE